MNLEELNELASHGEGETVEFKKTTGELKAGMKTVCAMLNGRGGFVLFGVGDSGRITGQGVTARTQEEVANEMRFLEPPAFLDIELVPINAQNSVLVLRVPKGSGPFRYDGRPFIRSGPTTRPMPQAQYERALMERLHSSNRWENQAAAGVVVADLDEAEIVRTVNEAIRRGRLDDPGTRDPRELLLGLHLIHEGHILNAAVVLFGRAERLMPRFPQCSLRVARFRGHDKVGIMDDNRQEVGNAFELLVRAQRFLRDHLPIAGRVVPNLFEREDDPLYPPVALREALANALCHRDYAQSGGAISIAIYDDRLEISSTGLLPFGLTPELLRRPHLSRPWNPLMANVFYRRGIIEQWGRGTLKMAELTAQAGLEPPEWEEVAGEVVVRFRPTHYVPPTRIAHDLSLLQRQLLAILSEHGPCSLAKLRVELPDPIPPRTVQNNLIMLRHYELVTSSGRGAGARWNLKAVPS